MHDWMNVGRKDVASQRGERDSVGDEGLYEMRQLGCDSLNRGDARRKTNTTAQFDDSSPVVLGCVRFRLARSQ